MSVGTTFSKVLVGLFGIALLATTAQAQSDVKAEENFLNGARDFKALLKAEPTLTADRTLLLPDANGTLMLNANPGIGGTGMLYGVSGPQNTALVSTYLFNVQYVAGAGAATGALITSASTGAGAMGLDVVATGAAGTATALRLASSGGATNYALDVVTGGIRIQSTLPTTTTASNFLVLEGGLVKTQTITTVDAGTTNNTTLRWNAGTSKWVENANVLATSTGDMTLNSASIKATTNQLILGTGTTTTINAAAPAASAVYTIPDVGTTASFVMTAGAQTIAGAKTLSNALTITPTTNQLVLGTTNTTTINATAPAASRTYTIPDAGANASFVMTEGAQTINGDKTLSGATSLTGVATAKAGVAIRFENPLGTFSTGFRAGAQTADLTYTLPTAAATGNQVLRANNTTPTNLEWVTLATVDAGTTTDATLRWNGTKWVENLNVLATSTGDMTLNSATIKATTNQLILGTTNTTTINAAAPAASAVYTIPDVGTTASFVMTAGAQTIGGAKTLSSALTITPTTNQLVLGTTNTTTINAAAPAASSVYTIPDVGTTGSFVMTTGTQTITGDKTLSGATTLSGTTSISGAATIKNTTVLEPTAAANINGATGGTIAIAATFVKQTVTINGGAAPTNVDLPAGTADGQILCLRLNVVNAGGAFKISFRNSNASVIEVLPIATSKRFYQLMYSTADTQWMILSSQVIN